MAVDASTYGAPRLDRTQRLEVLSKTISRSKHRAQLGRERAFAVIPLLKSLVFIKRVLHFDMAQDGTTMWRRPNFLTKNQLATLNEILPIEKWINPLDGYWHSANSYPGQ